jgi:hypothetical protein
MDRLIFAGLYRLAPTVLNALAVLKPDTIIKWHRAGYPIHRAPFKDFFNSLLKRAAWLD